MTFRPEQLLFICNIPMKISSRHPYHLEMYQLYLYCVKLCYLYHITTNRSQLLIFSFWNYHWTISPYLEMCQLFPLICQVIEVGRGRPCRRTDAKSAAYRLRPRQSPQDAGGPQEILRVQGSWPQPAPGSFLTPQLRMRPQHSCLCSGDLAGVEDKIIEIKTHMLNINTIIYIIIVLIRSGASPEHALENFLIF